MDPIFSQNFEITDIAVDCFGRLLPSKILFLAQEAAGRHCTRLGVDYETLAAKNLFWAVTRHRVQITRLPTRGETIRVDTWPMPTTRVAYPRTRVAYDEQGSECFRSISLWVLMHTQTRAMVLPGKSGIEVKGILRGSELDSPAGIPAKELSESCSRSVCFTDLDRNGHMNNTRYLDWAADLLPAHFHKERTLKEFTVCYLAEALEGQTLSLHWQVPDDGPVLVDARRQKEDQTDRIFAGKFLFG